MHKLIAHGKLFQGAEHRIHACLYTAATPAPAKVLLLFRILLFALVFTV